MNIFKPLLALNFIHANLLEPQLKLCLLLADGLKYIIYRPLIRSLIYRIVYPI